MQSSQKVSGATPITSNAATVSDWKSEVLTQHDANKLHGHRSGDPSVCDRIAGGG